MNLQLSRSGDYAVRATLHLALQPAERTVPLREIASAQEVPEAFLEKLLGTLIRGGLVSSRRGAKGGFRLARPAQEISLRQIIETVDGPIALNRCVSGEEQCERLLLCPIHKVWQLAQTQLLAILESTTLDEMAQEAQARRVISEGLS